MGIKYELVKSIKGFNLIEIDGEKPKGIPDGKNVMDILRANSNRKVIGTTEYNLRGGKLHKLSLRDCNHLFRIKESREPKVNVKYKEGEFNSHDELKGVSEIIRLQMYNYLSGRIKHEEFIKVYYEYEAFLGERSITKVNGMVDNDKESEYSNGWMPDNENNDDEYFNDWLEDPELSRELTLDERSTMEVIVESFKDESGYVVIFQI